MLDIELQGELKEYVEATAGGMTTAAFGLPATARCFAASKLGAFVLFVVADDVQAQKYCEALSLFLEGAVEVIPAKEEVLLYKKALSHRTSQQQLRVLGRLLRGELKAAVITAEGLTRLYPSKERFSENLFTLRRDCEYDLSDCVRRLAAAGYRREVQAVEPGQFSVRGDILDVFPVQDDVPYRLEFFGDTLESVRTFDPETQLSKEQKEELLVCPATDFLLREGEADQLIEKLVREFASLNLEQTYLVRMNTILEEVTTALRAGSRDTALSYLMPFTKIPGPLADYLPEDTVVAVDEPKRLTDRLELIYREHDARFSNLLQAGEVLKGHYGQLVAREELFRDFEGFRKTTYNNIATTANIFAPERVFHIKSIPTPRYNSNYKAMGEDISNWLFSRYAVAILCRDRETQTNVAAELNAANVFPRSELGPGKCTLIPNELSAGFVLHDSKLVVIGSSDFLRSRKSSGLHRRSTQVFTAPEVGDYVVHETHGIGICRGIKRLKLRFEKEYLSIEFRDGDMLYVPCDRLDELAKFSGSETAPKLNKLGGKEFAALKEKVRRSVHEMAIDLQKLYLERNQSKGYAFSRDSELQREFEDAFEFEETPDQLRCVEEIKRDMESGRVMDRLLCGDVGYGKTEVALRAAFKAISDGKQVAILSPTTILSQQHYNLCLKRFEGFGIRVGALNRFASARQQDAVVKKLREGKLDIVSGTHRLLSKDVSFFDLGLLIVDEEQRFGVEDKEKIKLLKKDVDVLTMSATPIPRTLHMSMTGIRDISVIETPPGERLPVQTYVVEYSETLVKDAVQREIRRGGQVFVLYNKVESIHSFAFKLSNLVPEASVVVAHGQMREEGLENAVMQFYSGEKNVLVCTTIIENGIDIPNANTLIVVDADRLGLSQLYQLKGRVGRSNRLAYVYFTYQQDKVLTENAYKRLNSIMEFTEFGSGFKIAMRDLEIRGAGSVLGREQHGHMEKVGYDMYVKLLKESVDELSGNAPRVEKVLVDADVDAFIPEDYIADDSARIRVYQTIADLKTESEGEECLTDLKDIYGSVPETVMNLIRIAVLRENARKVAAETVTVKQSGSFLTFCDNGVWQDNRLMDRVAEWKQECMMTISEKPMLVFRTKGLNLQQVFENIYNFLRNF